MSRLTFWGGVDSGFQAGGGGSFLKVILVLVVVQVQVAVRGGDLEEVPLGQGQVARDGVLAQGVQWVAVAEHTDRQREG